jgi:DNA topoisomerase IB
MSKDFQRLLDDELDKPLHRETKEAEDRVSKSGGPPGAGWEAIKTPRGGKRGFRRRKGGEYVYWYPGEYTSTRREREKGGGRVHGAAVRTLKDVREKYGPLNIANIPPKGSNLKKIKFQELNPKDHGSGACFKWWNAKTKEWKAGYSEEFQRRNAYKKWEMSNKLIPRLDEARDAFTADVYAKGASEDERDAAAVMSIIAHTGLRIGLETSLKKSGTRGVMTLSPESVTISGSKITFDFIGKTGKRNHAVIDHAALAGHLKKRKAQAEREGGDRLFPIKIGDVSAARQKAGFGEYKNKDFRTCVGTIAAADALANLDHPPPPMPENEKKAIALIRKRVLEAGADVAETLNNKPATALKSYIHPAVIYAWISDSGGGDLTEGFFDKASDGVSSIMSKRGLKLMRLALKVRVPRVGSINVEPEDEQEDPEVLESYPLPKMLQ